MRTKPRYACGGQPPTPTVSLAAFLILTVAWLISLAAWAICKWGHLLF